MERLSAYGAMTHTHPEFGAIDITHWPAANVASLEEAARQAYQRQEQAVRLYVAGIPLAASATDFDDLQIFKEIGA